MSDEQAVVETTGDEFIEVAPVMRHITKVRIENFQAHENTEVSLTPGINLVTGTSEAGKSALLRAINWVLHNVPRGDSFVCLDGEICNVTLVFSDGTEVMRTKSRKSKKKNSVTVLKPDGTKLTFDSIDKQLPPQALLALGEPPLDDQGRPLSYHTQKGSDFLVNDTAMNMTRTLSFLCGIQHWEKAGMDLKTEANDCKKAVLSSEDHLARLDEQLAEYDDLDEQLEIQAHLEAKATEIEARHQRILAARALLTRYKDIKAAESAAHAAVQRYIKIAAFADRLKPLVARSRKLTAARALKNKLVQINEQMAFAEAEALRYGKLATPGLILRVKTLKARKVKLDQVQALRAQLLALRKEWEGRLAIIRQLTQTINDKTAERDRLTDEMRHAGLWCDVCERPLRSKSEREEHAHAA